MISVKSVYLFSAVKIYQTMAMLRSMGQFFFTKLQTEVNQLVARLFKFRSSMVRPANISKSRPVSAAIVPKSDEQHHQKADVVKIRKISSVVSLKPSPRSQVPVNSHQNAAKGSASSFYNSVPALIRSYSNGEKKIQQFTVAVPKKGVSKCLLLLIITVK